VASSAGADGSRGVGFSPATPGERLTLEQIFLTIIGEEASLRRADEELSWLR